MRIVYEGEIINTKMDLDYDWLKIKYDTTVCVGKKPFIIVPSTYPKKSNKKGNLPISSNSEVHDEELIIRGSQKLINELEIGSDEKLHISADSETEPLDILPLPAHSNYLFSYEYKCCTERHLILTYYKKVKEKCTEGLLGYTEFKDWVVDKRQAVLTETFVVRKPFKIKEEFFGTYRTVQIESNVQGPIRLAVDSGQLAVVKQGEGKTAYKVFGDDKCYTIYGNNICYHFDSQVWYL